MVQFFAPSNEAEIKRRRMMAEQLRAHQIPMQTQVVSGVAVPNSPWAGLAGALSQGIAGYQEGKANEIEQKDTEQRQQFLRDALTKAGGDPAMLAQAFMENPSTTDAGLQLYMQNLKAQQKAQPTEIQLMNYELRRDAIAQKQEEKDQKRNELMDAEGRRASHALGENATTRAKIDEILNNPEGIKGATGWQSYFPTFPGSDTANAEADIETLKARSAFGGLQEMRLNSPTGGALGQVAVQELEMLKNAEASLQQAQSPEEYRKSLNDYKIALDNADKAVAEAYRDKYGQYPNGYMPSGGAANTGSLAVGTEEDGYVYLGGDPANPNSWRAK